MQEQHNRSMILNFNPENGVLEVHPPQFFKDKETVEDAKENLKTGLALSAGNLKGIIAEMPGHYVNAEVTLYYKNNVPDVPIAMIANSPFKVMIGNFMLSLARPKRPTALFKNKEDALEWLERMILTKEKSPSD